MKTAELTGAALDWAVAKCEGAWVRDGIDDDCPEYSTNWAQGGTIIEREEISVYRTANGLTLYWVAEVYEGNSILKSEGQTPLIAAMRCYVANKLGEDVDVPEELK